MAPSKSQRSRVKRHGLKRKTIARRKAKEHTKNTSLSRISPISFTVSPSHPSSTTSAEPLLGTIIPPALIDEPSTNLLFSADGINKCGWCLAGGRGY